MRRPTKRGLLAVLATSLALTPLAAAHAEADNRLEWQPCESDDGTTGMECASIEVPVNWAKPDGRRITLELGRLPSTGPEPAEGSVLVAYGGPGAPGIAFTQQDPKPWSKLRERMDIVTWDTRGYGEQFGGTSTGLDCTWTRLPTPNVPPDAAEFDRLAQTNYGNAYPCGRQQPVLFDHMSSADHARDMEAIRRALGEPKLNFYGASYAGIYAQAYARLFPEKLRTMVLDGTFSHSTEDWDAELDAHARRNETTIGRFFDWCTTETSCVLHRRDIERIWQRLVAKAERSPIAAKQDGATYHYDGSDLRAFGLGMAWAKEWGPLAKAIRNALHGDASAFVPKPPESPYSDVLTGITECLELPHAKSYEELVETFDRLDRIAPNTGAAGTLAGPTLHCVGWPTPMTNPPAPLPDDLPPFVGAGAWNEYEAVQPVLDQVPGSGSIFHDDAGHTLYPFNACARRHIDRYFTDRVVPERGTEC